MKLKSFDSLYLHVMHAYNNSASKVFNTCLILIGGCSRSGKTSLSMRISEKLFEDNISNVVVPLDAWLISLEKRNQSSTVVERYECDAMVKSFEMLLHGRAIFPPVYDSFSRRRISERSDQPLFIPSGVVIADGVIALALPDLRRRASLKIFVDIENSERKQGLRDFYIKYKRLSPVEAEKVIGEREQEEVPYIQNTQQYADVIFVNEVSIFPSLKGGADCEHFSDRQSGVHRHCPD